MKIYEDNRSGMRAMFLPNGMLFQSPSGHFGFVPTWGLSNETSWNEEADSWLKMNSFVEIRYNHKTGMEN
jgi:hypothetical protein